MTLEELRLQVQHLVNFTPGTVGQDFPGVAADANRHVDWGINEAYRLEVELGKQNGMRRAFMRRHTVNWPADVTLLAIPEQLIDVDLLALRDDTNNTPGTLVTFPDGFYIADRLTWGWTSPPPAMTLTALYLSSAQEMKDRADVPSLIPQQHHSLLVWSAGVLMRSKADERPPEAWLRQRDEHRRVWYKSLSVGSPMLSSQFEEMQPMW